MQCANAHKKNILLDKVGYDCNNNYNKYAEIHQLGSRKRL